MDEIRNRSTSFVESLEYLIVKYPYYDLGSDIQTHVDWQLVLPRKPIFVFCQKGLIIDRDLDNYFTAEIKEVRTSET